VAILRLSRIVAEPRQIRQNKNSNIFKGFSGPFEAQILEFGVWQGKYGNMTPGV
jgi:hypothetical protein